MKNTSRTASPVNATADLSKVKKQKSHTNTQNKLRKVKELLAAKRSKELEMAKQSGSSSSATSVHTKSPASSETADKVHTLKGKPNSSPSLSKLQQKMQQKLKGARFRWINETLYTTTGDKAFEMVQNDPRIFEEYHQGFSAQVEKWPVNPVDVFIKQLQQRDRLVVADMGCGEAKLAATVGNQHTVHSFDLVAYNSLITPCNIAEVPLEDATADMVIFCLALMGTDFIKFIREANRILRQGGELKIAEVVSRVTDIAAFVSELETQGFRLKHKDAANKMFIMLDFVKIRPFSEASSRNNNSELLKPCIYKRR
ncbi:25S rRNA (adenine645-N1)-methyltransferase [Coemansia sp. RSA 2703]|nr:25S rRNA (adenine645-N1)-methyltransferase [Coemansia sp. RSA 2703]KAJ2369153.1 25S rRNA (adenine645-N1)-methyltransferase [Coemansia sp. RSA 2607]KAJ2390867.1 25S rRNA (adenine645-N1)-methyltransferase [Coemansia sp. RSA 2603]